MRPPSIPTRLRSDDDRLRESIVYASRQLLGAFEQWRRLGDPGEPALQAGWQHKPGFQPLEYFKDSEGFVHLRGAAIGSTAGASTVFVLPQGYRPDDDLLHYAFYRWQSTGSSLKVRWALLYILTDGQVRFEPRSLNAVADDWLTFDNHVFRAV